MSSICQMLAETLVAHSSDWDDPLDLEEATEISDALLASPLADIIDLAAQADQFGFVDARPEVIALLADWKANR